MNFREDLISMQDISTLRYHLHSQGILNSDEMECLNSVMPHSRNRYDQVYQLLSFLNQKPNGPFSLIEVLKEMASEHNFIGEIANTLTKEYRETLLFSSDHNVVASIRNLGGLCSNHDLPGIDSQMLEVLTISSKFEKIKWEQCGLVLNIPEDAVVTSGHSKTLQLQVSVGFGGQLRYPCPFDCDIVSGVYSLTIRGGMLSKPIKAEVQHCAAHMKLKQENSKLQFLTAKVTKSSRVPYEMSAQHKCTSFSPMSTNGTIDLQGSLLNNKDTGVIFTICPSSQDILSRYCVRIFYQKVQHTVGEMSVHITVTKDLEICSKVFYLHTIPFHFHCEQHLIYLQLLDEVYPSCRWYTEPNDSVVVCLRDVFTISLPSETRIDRWHISATSTLSVSCTMLVYASFHSYIIIYIFCDYQLPKSYLEGIHIYRSKQIPHFALQLVWIGSTNTYSSEHLNSVLCSPSVVSYELPVEGTIEPHVCTSLHLSTIHHSLISPSC